MTTRPTTRKATHKGTCQACARFQKLPGNVLSKHGYTIRWGFFTGDCPGSGRKPFEVSTDFIEECIAHAESVAASLRRTAVETRALTGDDGLAWHHTYVPATGTVRHSSYRWERLKIEAVVNEHGFRSLTVTTDVHGGTGSHERRTETVGYRDADIAATARELNAVYAANRDKEATKYDAYVVWQTKRVANWTPGTLTPLESSDSSRKGPLLHAVNPNPRYNHRTACWRSIVGFTGRSINTTRAENTTCPKCLAELAKSPNSAA